MKTLSGSSNTKVVPHKIVVKYMCTFLLFTKLMLTQLTRTHKNFSAFSACMRKLFVWLLIWCSFRLSLRVEELSKKLHLFFGSSSWVLARRLRSPSLELYFVHVSNLNSSSFVWITLCCWRLYFLSVKKLHCWIEKFICFYIGNL